MSWRPGPKSSRSETRPPVPSKTYALSTFNIGIALRSALIASRNRVASFSLARSVRRAASQSACDTTLGRSIVRSFLLGRRRQRLSSRLRANNLEDERGHAAGGRGTGRDDRCCSHETRGTHGLLLAQGGRR